MLSIQSVRYKKSKKSCLLTKNRVQYKENKKNMKKKFFLFVLRCFALWSIFDMKLVTLLTCSIDLKVCWKEKCFLMNFFGKNEVKVNCFLDCEMIFWQNHFIVSTKYPDPHPLREGPSTIHQTHKKISLLCSNKFKNLIKTFSRNLTTMNNNSNNI